MTTTDHGAEGAEILARLRDQIARLADGASPADEGDHARDADQIRSDVKDVR